MDLQVDGAGHVVDEQAVPGRDTEGPGGGDVGLGRGLADADGGHVDQLVEPRPYEADEVAKRFSAAFMAHLPPPT